MHRTSITGKMATILNMMLVSHMLIYSRNIPGVLSQTHHNDMTDENILNEPLMNVEETPKCQKMQIRFCEKVDYNKTMLPSPLGHQTQADIESEINAYEPLVRVGCSPDLRLFLCTAYAPICDDENAIEEAIQPCRSLCESVKQGCAPHLKTFANQEWPLNLRCEMFPNGRETGRICVGNDSYNPVESTSDSERPTGHREIGFVCPKNFEVNSYKLYLNGKVYNNCAMPCEDVYLDRNGARIIRATVGIFATICVVSTIFTCITFLLDTKRFKYPARPLIIIALCQLVVATCYLTGYLTQNKLACNDPAEPPKTLPNMKMIRTTTMGNKKGSCTLQFMALYFFQTSTMFWWLMMTISWYMIAKLKWAPEAVSGVSRYFHLISWTVPALLTIYISVLGDIEGDSLTGICNVSVSNLESVTSFVIFPTAVCLILGCLFLAMGFKSVWDSREILRREYGKQADEHYKLVSRIGIYSLLVITISTLFIYSHHFDQINQIVWKLSWLSNICKNREYSLPCPPRDFSHQRPHYSIFLLKYISTMAIGIISSGFMFSHKTMRAYYEVAEMVNYKLGFQSN